MTSDNKNRTGSMPPRKPHNTVNSAAHRPVQNPQQRAMNTAQRKKPAAASGARPNPNTSNVKNTHAQHAHQPKKKENPKLALVKKIFAILGTTILSIFLIVVITGTIVTTAATVYVLEFMDETSDVTIGELASSANTIVYAKKSKDELVELYTVKNDVQRVPVDIDKIPQHVRDAFVCIEDERFYSHEGVDYKRTFAAFANMFIHIYDTRQGGSTITQQLIKNLTGDDDPSPERKIREIFRAMQFEKKYSKDEILENYLNYIGFGGPTNGIQLAAVKYFGKDVSELSIAEAACLAAIPKSPEELNPFAGYEDDETGKWVNTGKEKNRERQENVLLHMYANGTISYDQYQAALKEELVFTDSEEYLKEHPEANADKLEKQKATSWVVDTALREYAAILMDEYGIDEDEAFARINNGGYQIYTTVNLKMQDYVEEKFLDLSNLMDPDSNYTYDDDDNKIHPQSAFIALNYKGEIQCVVGGIGEKTSSLSFNRATMGKRQPGSCMKPVSTYGLALYTDHIHWGSMYKDSPITLEETGKQWPNNYDYVWSGNSLPVYDALRRSRNTVPAQLCKELTPLSVFNFSTKNLGMDLVSSTESGASDIAYAPLTIGALTYGVTIENLVNAYLPYGNGGTYYNSHIISRVEKGDGSLVYDNDGSPREAVDKETAYVMNKLLQEVIKNGTGTAAQLDNKTVAGKTGTSEDWNDLCFVGMTEDFVSGVWIGYDKKAELNTGLSSAQVWYNIIGEYANKVKSDKHYPECDSVISASVCTNSGCIAESGCPKGGTGYWKSTNAPYCSNHSYSSTSKTEKEESEPEEEEKPEESSSQADTIEVVPETPEPEPESSSQAAEPEPDSSSTAE
ncbi:MAG: transglycosylase domain-containing protein [Clostridium sp.]|nr:transglycosylase domain-containing protein [Clostridium sp.]MCM1546768.1 transglycosylase domain-containing protein [Ruminococcus sp.]